MRTPTSEAPCDSLLRPRSFMTRLLVVSCAFLIGCGAPPAPDAGMTPRDAGTDAGTDAGATVSPSGFCSQTDPAYCSRAVACGLFETNAGCLSRVASPVCAENLAAIADGRASFSAAAAVDCLTQPPVCTPAANVCSTVFQPLVAQGGSCFNNRECVQGLSCRNWDGLTTQCPGTCQPRVGDGQTLHSGEECLEGLQVSWEELPDGGLARQVMCRSPLLAGRSCSVNSIVNLPCAAGLTCRGETLTCGTPRPDGEACVAIDGGFFVYMVEDCVRGSRCLPRDGGSSCAPWAPPALGGVGQPCGMCKADLRCLNGTCAPLGGAGQSCLRSFFRDECASGFFCLPPETDAGISIGGGERSGTCSPRLPVGSRCTGGDCLVSLTCNLVAAADGGFGSESRCAPDLRCADRTP